MKDRAKALKEFAKKLNDSQFTDFYYKKKVHAEARRKGIIIVFSEAYDLCVMQGAIWDEIDGEGGRTVFINSTGFIYSYSLDCDPEDCPAHKYWMDKTGTELKIIWSEKGTPHWQYETEIPHEKFNIYDADENEIYCECIVFYADELKQG